MKFDLFTVFPDENEVQTLSQLLVTVPDEGVENEVVNLYPGLQENVFEGFGGAITDSAAFVYSLMPEELKEQMLKCYFSPDQMNYQTVRIHMDSCDFSTDMYEADSDPEDEDLEHFSFARTEEYIIPMLRDAERIAGRKLDVMLTPWSPPAYMKTNGSRVGGGSLKPEYRDRWAKYICRYIREFQDSGFHVARISIQNEAKAVQPWDSCIVTAEEEKIFLRDHLYPELQRQRLTDVEVYIWDHNKERVYERVRDTVDADTREMITGAAVHWYSGDHFESLDLVREQYPDLKLILSESCIEFCKFRPEAQALQAVKIAHEIIGDLAHGISLFYDWNLVLDERGGPNHVGNFCGAPFHYNAQSRNLTSGLLLSYVKAVCKTIVPGSKRIRHTVYDRGLDVCAFLSPDGKMETVVLNTSDERKKVIIRIGEEKTELILEPMGIAALKECL